MASWTRLDLLLRRRRRAARIHNDLLIDSFLGIPMLGSLPGGDSRLVCINIEDANPTMITTIATITTKTGAAGITHPQCGFLLLLDIDGRQSAIFVRVVTGR